MLEMVGGRAERGRSKRGSAESAFPAVSSLRPSHFFFAHRGSVGIASDSNPRNQNNREIYRIGRGPRSRHLLEKQELETFPSSFFRMRLHLAALKPQHRFSKLFYSMTTPFPPIALSKYVPLPFLLSLPISVCLLLTLTFPSLPPSETSLLISLSPR